MEIKYTAAQISKIESGRSEAIRSFAKESAYMPHLQNTRLLKSLSEHIAKMDHMLADIQRNGIAFISL